jgi:hypothetical protein
VGKDREPEVAAQVHSGAEIFQKPGEFPAAESIDLPLSTHALHYYKSGRPFLQRHLPFWLAVMGEQLLVLAIPIAGILYPLANGLSAPYGWGMSRRIFLIYGELLWLESEMESRDSGRSTDDLSARLQVLERRSHRVRVPRMYLPLLYTLKEHLGHISVDDLGWMDTGFQGSTYYETPNADRLAREGVIFRSAHASAPNCAPSRASLLSGQYPPRHGVYTVASAPSSCICRITRCTPPCRPRANWCRTLRRNPAAGGRTTRPMPP